MGRRLSDPLPAALEGSWGIGQLFYAAGAGAGRPRPHGAGHQQEWDAVLDVPSWPSILAGLIDD